MHNAGLASFLSDANGEDKNKVKQEYMSSLNQIAKVRILPHRKVSKSNAISLSQNEVTRLEGDI